MIIVSSYQDAPSVINQYEPGFVVSVIEHDECAPNIPGDANHIILSGSAASPEVCAAACKQIIQLADKWLASRPSRAPILIHCTEGVCRSMALAYVLLCAIEKNTCEEAIAMRIREAAPHADPNMMIVAKADSLLGRNDRMINAMLDLPPCSAGAVTSSIILPVAA